MNYLMTFTEGLVSFISPCTLPLMPVFVAYFASDGRNPLKRVLAFIIGFSTVFILLGVTSASIGSFLAAHQAAVKIVSGALLIFMALVFVEIIPLRLPWSGKAGAPPTSAVLFGILFAVNLTPCVGAFLAAALVAAAGSDSALEGAALLGAYSLGLAVPFLVAALALSRVNFVFARIKSGYRVLIPVCMLSLIGYGGWLIYRGVTMSDRSGGAAPVATAPAADSAQYGGEVVEIKSIEQFTSEIAGGIAVVDFWAPWCGPCRRMAPVLKEVASEFPNIKVLKVNVDDFDKLAQSYDVSGIPAIFRFDDGKLTARSIGSMPKDRLLTQLKLR